MLIVIFGIAFLLLGYIFYSRLLERIIKPYQEPTPAYTKGAEMPVEFRQGV